MIRDAANVLKDALALPSEARAALIDSLIDSLDHVIDDGAEEAWREEIHRSLQETLEPFSSYLGRTLAAASALVWSSDERLRSDSPCCFGGS